MPIKQERMLELLAAAQDFEQALSRALEQVAREAGLAAQGRKGADEALATMQILLRRDVLLQRPVESPMAIALETAHFSTSRQRHNARAALRAARVRATGAKTEKGKEA